MKVVDDREKLSFLISFVDGEHASVVSSTIEFLGTVTKSTTSYAP